MDGSKQVGLSTRDARPKTVGGVDLRTLPIGPEEAFVLSRVDGQASTSEIALSTGLPLDRVERALAKLAAEGAVDLGAAAGPAATTDPAGGSARADANPGERPAAKTPLAGSSSPAPSALYDPAELDEEVDLPLERKRAILETFHRLETLDHYALLKIDRHADKKTIKSAYYELVNIYHPDKYYGKSLGSFRTKLDKLFQRVTEAHDTLTRKKSRADYDRYLESRHETRALDQLADPDAQRAELAEIERQIQQEARARQEGVSPPPPGNTSISSPRISRPALSTDERRRALARKFRGSLPPQRASQTSMPAATGPTAQQAAAQALKNRYEERVLHARRERIGRYLQQADEAKRAGNVVSEANALRIALSLAPEDAELRERFERVEHSASALLSEKYLEQAQYEERTGHFAAAAATYQRALKGRPSARLYERTAHCLLSAEGDLKQASELAKRAVELSPEPAYRITLARIYAKANMAQSALAELERARAENPSDDKVKDWIKRIKRGEI